MKNAKKIGLMFLVAIVAVGTYFVSGTYAKYTSSLTGTSTAANVARWKWNINTTDIVSSATNTFTYEVFGTVKDDDLTSTETGTKSGLIAPGTGGSVTLDITNKSEVDGTYTVTFAETQSGVPAGITRIPVEYRLGTEGTWTPDITSLTTTETLNRNDSNAETGTPATQSTLYWRWVFNGTDADDTAIGFAANGSTVPSVAVTATVVLTQVDQRA